MEATPSVTCCPCPAQPSAEGFSGQTGLKRPFPSHPTWHGRSQALRGKSCTLGQPQGQAWLLCRCQGQGRVSSVPFPFQCCLSPSKKEEGERPEPCLHLDKGTSVVSVLPLGAELTSEIPHPQLTSITAHSQPLSIQHLQYPNKPHNVSCWLLGSSLTPSSAHTTPPATLGMSSPQQDWSSRAPQSRMECTSFFSACALSKASVKGR